MDEEEGGLRRGRVEKGEGCLRGKGGGRRGGGALGRWPDDEKELSGE